MTDEYTPTTDEVRTAFSLKGVVSDGMTEDLASRFDEWLREHDASVLEDAAETREPCTLGHSDHGEGHTIFHGPAQATLRRLAATIREGAKTDG